MIVNINVWCHDLFLSSCNEWFKTIILNDTVVSQNCRWRADVFYCFCINFINSFIVSIQHSSFHVEYFKLLKFIFTSAKLVTLLFFLFYFQFHSSAFTLVSATICTKILLSINSSWFEIPALKIIYLHLPYMSHNLFLQHKKKSNASKSIIDMETSLTITIIFWCNMLFHILIIHLYEWMNICMKKRWKRYEWFDYIEWS